MPRPIRFVAAWFAGSLLMALLLPAAASVQSGGRAVWTALFNWLGSGAFWSALWLLAALTAGALLLSRVAARAGLAPLLSGLIGGLLAGLCYLVFYVSGSDLPRDSIAGHLGAGAALFVGTLALAGAFMAWFWRRAS